MMRTHVIASALFAFLFASPLFAQDRTTVNATSSEISDNLDLRAVASIFGESRNLEDFERQLNDPATQISNLDLNDDNRVDYLRVIESVEGYTHLVVVQAVLGRDTFQDVATIEVERDHHNQVSVQVVGDVYMYGPNYIYEPVYVQTPVIYTSFWVTSYRPYCSSWYWDYYPTYYYAWNPCPVFRYRNNVNVYINFSNHYDYVSVRRSQRAVALYAPRRANYCERQYPTRAFAYRNTSVRNRYELDQTRNIRNVPNRNNGLAYNNPGASTRRNEAGMNSGRANNSSRAESPSRENRVSRGDTNGRSDSNPVRETRTPRNDNGARSDANPIRENRTQGNNAARSESNSRRDNPVASRERSNTSRESNFPQRESTGRSNDNSGRDFGNAQRANPAPVRENSRSESAGRSNANSGSMQRNSPQPRMESRGNSGGAQRQSALAGNGGGNEQRGGRR